MPHPVKNFSKNSANRPVDAASADRLESTGSTGHGGQRQEAAENEFSPIVAWGALPSGDANGENIFLLFDNLVSDLFLRNSQRELLRPFGVRQRCGARASARSYNKSGRLGCKPVAEDKFQTFQKAL